MKKAIEFQANGKLLITGEYLVLVGAKALALPVRFGQRMTIQESPVHAIEWVSLANHSAWFNARFDPESLKAIEADRKNIAHRLTRLLQAARRLNPEFLTGQKGWNVRVTANYPLAWGLGSSATLCYLVAEWARVPEFELYRQVSQGSGYDIACAGQTGLLCYQLRKGQQEITPARAGRALREFTYFAYLGNKQDSSREVAAFFRKTNYTEIDLVSVSELSNAICDADSYEELARLVKEHEYILSTILKKEPLALQFSNFHGAVKSLGAWGGDFAMFVSNDEPTRVIRDLHHLGLTKVFKYAELEID
jgi:mevalonate kinase